MNKSKKKSYRYNDDLDIGWNLSSCQSYDETLDEMLQILKIQECLSEERPEEDYGVKMLFAAGFIKPEMEEGFMSVASEFLKKEERVKKGNENKLFHNLPYPLNMDFTIRSTFIQAVLLVMLACAEDGSSFAEEILKGLYKTYYKKEYNILKRLRTLDIRTFCDCFMEEKDQSENGEDDTDERAARLTVMCDLFHIDIDSTWNHTYVILNNRVEEERVLWRTIQVISMSQDLQDRKAEDRRRYAEWIAECYPEMASYSIYSEDRRYKVLDSVRHMVEIVLEEMDVSTSILQGEKLDLFLNAERGLCDSNISLDEMSDKFADKKWNHREILLISYIRYLATLLGRLYKEREEELFMVLAVSKLELVSDDELLNDRITKDMIDRLSNNSEDDSSDYRMDRLLTKIKSMKSEQMVERSIKTQNDTRVRTRGEKEGSEIYDEQRECEILKESLQEYKQRLAEEENKVRTQRALYEESREKIRSLENIIDKQADEHVELVALRELVYGLDKPQVNDISEDVNIDFMIRKLNTVKGVIIGGQNAWINRMKKILPNWVFISAGDSLNLDRLLGGVEEAFVFTDMLTHKMYYKMMAAIRRHGVPFHFIHGMNTEKVIRLMYEAVES